MSRTNGKVKQETVQEIASDIGLESAQLISVLSQMGIKNLTEDSEVSPAIAANVRRVAASRAKCLTSGEDGDKEVRELSKTEVKQIAKQGGSKVTQALVRSIDASLLEREVQIAFLEGYQEVERRNQLQIAKEAGAIAANLQALEKRGKELDSREQELINEGLGRMDHAAIAAKALGLDIGSLRTRLQEKAETEAPKRMDQAEALELIKEGRQEELTDEVKSDPFIQLALLRATQG